MARFTSYFTPLAPVHVTPCVLMEAFIAKIVRTGGQFLFLHLGKIQLGSNVQNGRDIEECSACMAPLTITKDLSLHSGSV